MIQENKAIKSGWRGHLNGVVESTDSHIEVSRIALNLDHATAYALCNLLCDGALETANFINNPQREKLSKLGSALGRMVDHSAANNGGQEIINP